MVNVSRRCVGSRPSAPVRATQTRTSSRGHNEQHSYTGVQQAIAAQGYQDLEPLVQGDTSDGCMLLKGTSSDGAAVVITALSISGATHASTVVTDVLERSGLSHPHILAARSVFRKDNWLCIVQEFANGGDMFSLARRCVSDGLPESTARFLIQQLALTFAFVHQYGVSLQEISPSKLLIAWTAKGMPILKVNLLKTLQNLLPTTQRASGKPMRMATMYSSIHWLRESIALHDSDTQAAAAPFCDLWSVAVTLYFLLFGRWPFSKAQISRWVHTAASDWADDDLVSYDRASGPAPSEEVISFLKAVFATGRCTLAELQNSPEPLTLAAAIRTEWFRTDLPAGAEDMNATCHTKSEERQQSSQYAALRSALQQFASPSPTQ